MPTSSSFSSEYKGCEREESPFQSVSQKSYRQQKGQFQLESKRTFTEGADDTGDVFDDSPQVLQGTEKGLQEEGKDGTQDDEKEERDRRDLQQLVQRHTKKPKKISLFLFIAQPQKRMKFCLCDNLNGCRVYCVQRNKSDRKRQLLYVITHVESQK